MDNNRLAEIRVRAERATLGAWRDDRRADGVPAVHNGKVRICDTFRADGQSVLDAEFIAHAREDVPAMLDEIARLRTIAENAQDCYVSEMAAHSRTRAELEAATKQINGVRSCKMCVHREHAPIGDPCVGCSMIVKQHFEWARPYIANTPDAREGGGET